MTEQCDSATERDTYTLAPSLWDFAPERWVTPDDRESYRVVRAEIVGEPGSEELVVEIERYNEDESDE